MAASRSLIEKEFFVMEVDKKNKNHRTYQKHLVQRWIDDPKLKSEGYDIEYVVDDVEFETEYLKDDRVCGNVFDLRLEGNRLFAKAKFKIDGPYADIIYGEKDFIEKTTIVPKGKGAIKNHTLQDDYELYGFNLIMSHESSFLEEETVATVESK
jgi:hypothetical protein